MYPDKWYNLKKDWLHYFLKIFWNIFSMATYHIAQATLKFFILLILSDACSNKYTKPYRAFEEIQI